MREWKEIGRLLLSDSGGGLLIRSFAFNQDGTQTRGVEVLLNTDEVYELYIMLKNKLAAVIEKKYCTACKHNRYYGCMHPDKEVRGYVCERAERKYFEPKFQL
jgi:hypothetical protein